MGTNLIYLRDLEDPIVTAAAKEVLKEEMVLENYHYHELEKLHRLFREQGLHDAALIVDGFMRRRIY